MKELLDKLSSYNLFNYLLPGTVFVAAAQRISAHTFKDENIVVELFLYYFIGMVISRIGSLTIEPALKILKFIEFAEYKDSSKPAKRTQRSRSFPNRTTPTERSARSSSRLAS